MKLFLIRHGQTTANVSRKAYCGQTDVPLTELGRQQAEAIRPILSRHQFDRVFSSDLSISMRVFPKNGFQWKSLTFYGKSGFLLYKEPPVRYEPNGGLCMGLLVS